MLSEKVRLCKALCLEEVDRLPCICPGGMMNMVTKELMEKKGIFWPEAHTDAEMMAELATAAYEMKCFENYGLPFCMTVEVEEMGAAVDMGSLIYEPHVVDYPITTVSGWRNLSPLDCIKGRAAVVIEATKVLSAKNGDVPIIGNLTGPISVAASLVEPTIFYKELRRKKRRGPCFYGVCYKPTHRIW